MNCTRLCLAFTHTLKTISDYIMINLWKLVCSYLKFTSFLHATLWSTHVHFVYSAHNEYWLWKQPDDAHFFFLFIWFQSQALAWKLANKNPCGNKSNQMLTREYFTKVCFVKEFLTQPAIIKERNRRKKKNSKHKRSQSKRKQNSLPCICSLPCSFRASCIYFVWVCKCVYAVARLPH